MMFSLSEVELLLRPSKAKIIQFTRGLIPLDLLFILR